MTNISTSAVTSAIRTILRLSAPVVGLTASDRIALMTRGLRDLETSLPSRDPSAFETDSLDAFGYDTVLGFMNKYDPLTLLGMDDPVRDTIQTGREVTRRCLERGLKVVRVPACEHVKARYAKVDMVNAYPILVLNEVVFGGVWARDENTPTSEDTTYEIG